ncbi:MAG TPA: HD domain-containing protein, partial [Pyrodictium sp.]|nr:HD domain-containing protein [Pyrodictium sp.]
MVRKAVSPKAGVVLESLFYAVPADTRPGLNATSLLVHLLLVSGAAASIARARLAKAAARSKSCSIDIPVVRLAGLLHDAGKPLDPTAHVPASLDAARGLLEGLVPGFVLEAVLGLIESHHRDKPSERIAEAIDQYVGRLFALDSNEIHTILRCSDHMMSGMDRLEALIDIVLEGEVDAPGAREAREALERLASKLAEKMRIENPREALRGLYSGDWGARSTYNELLSSPDGAELVAEASEALAKLLARPRRTILEKKLVEKAKWPPLSCKCKSTGEELDELLMLTVVDIGGIQSGLSESFRIRSMAGFSLLVDFVTMAAVPYALTLYGAPLEAIVFTGGGTVHAIAPAMEGSVEDSEGKIHGKIVEVLSAKPVYRLSLDGIRVRVAAAELGSPLYAEVVRNAYARLGVKELQPARTQSGGCGNGVRRWLERLLAGAAKPCDSCGQRPAVVKHHDEEYCLVCAARYSVSETFGYSLSGERKGLRIQLLEELGIERLLYPWIREGALDVLAAIAEAVEEGYSANYAIVK